MPNPKLNQPLGDFVALQTTAEGLYVQTTHGSLEVVAYRPSVVRFRANAHPHTREAFSYAVVAQPETSDFRVVEEAQAITLATAQLVVELTKYPVRVRCLTPGGAVINEDDPAFGTSWLGDQATTYKKLQPGERFLGLGEKTGPLDRRGAAYLNWNTDSFAYGPESDPIYATFPFYVGVVPPEPEEKTGLAYGIFMDNSHRSYFNFGASNQRFASFAAEAGEMDYYFFHGPVAQILDDYTWLTGRMPLPPRWSLGYQQCRYSYYPDKEVLTLARNFRDKQMPADVIHLDIHYMDAYKIFTWDAQRFAQHRQLLAELKAMGFEVVVICDPGIKVEPGYAAYDDGLAKDIFVKYPDGTPHTAQVWPGWCHFPDFTSPRARAWWGDQLRGYLADGIRGFWNDMNEPASWGQRNPDLVEHDYEGQRTSHRQAHNVYGLQMCRSTFDGAKNALAEGAPAGERPFVLTRAAYNGIQRYAAVWTGDNTSSDDHMLAGVRLVNSLGLTGVAFAGYDVGGFVGECPVPLFARWISLGAFAPFFRGHTMINTRDQEPWAFGEEVEAISRNYLGLRYRLLPYLYAAFYEATQNGLPVARTLAIDYTFDARVYDHRYQNQYLFGKYFLVAPVESTKQLTKVYLPEGDWYNFFTNESHNGEREIVAECPIELLPVFVKAGAIVPMQSAVQHTSQPTDGVLYLHIYYLAGVPGFEESPHFGRTSLVHYEDDGRTYAHEAGAYHRRTITYSDTEGQIVLSAAEGSYPSAFHTIRLVLHGFEEVGPHLAVNGQPVPVREERLVMLPPLPSFDPLGRENLELAQVNKVAEFANQTGEVVVTW
jgi:alpha-glucosidase